MIKYVAYFRVYSSVVLYLLLHLDTLYNFCTIYNLDTLYTLYSLFNYTLTPLMPLTHSTISSPSTFTTPLPPSTPRHFDVLGNPKSAHPQEPQQTLYTLESCMSFVIVATSMMFSPLPLHTLHACMWVD